MTDFKAERDAYRAALEGISANETECEGCRLMVRVASVVLLQFPTQCKHALTICAECRFPASSWPERREMLWEQPNPPEGHPSSGDAAYASSRADELSLSPVVPARTKL